ncbi:MAG: hypothetical protein OEY01_09430 [Desulfobulbaceae bacterium]|nr:hypothetical protein [Desulfobulbaceae bacterium]HIJ79225.1 hypothetical protein [Deltaproteobacteria bacterium]
MESFQQFIAPLWVQLVWPLVRIMLLVSVGIVAANFIEALNWTHRLALLARPLIRLGRLSAITGASFSMAFFSGVSANTMLAEAYDQGRIAKKELVLANLFNSLPRFFLHLPTVFFLTAPFIKGAAVLYVGITFGAAALQTMLVVVAGRLLMARPMTVAAAPEPSAERKKISWRQAFDRSWLRFRKRIPKVLGFIVPIYIIFYLLSRYGIFKRLEELIAAKAWFLAWLDPKSLSIVILHVTAEFSAGLAAAGVMLADNSLGYREVVLALLAGNVLASPVRALRHQFPYYVGIFTPRLAAELVGLSQAFRIGCIVLVGGGYYFYTL